MIRTKSALLAITLAAASVQPANAAEKQLSVVLVHGAFVDASGWRPVYDRLTKDGYEVLVVQNPTITLKDDLVRLNRSSVAYHHRL